MSRVPSAFAVQSAHAAPHWNAISLPFGDARQRGLYVFPDSYHGWDLLYTAPSKKRAGRILLRFLRAHS